MSVENFSCKPSRKHDLNPRFPIKVKGSRKEVEPYFNFLNRYETQRGQIAHYEPMQRSEQSQIDPTVIEKDPILTAQLELVSSKSSPCECKKSSSITIKEKCTTGTQVNLYHCRECRSHTRSQKMFGTALSETGSEVYCSSSLKDSLRRDSFAGQPIAEEGSAGLLNSSVGRPKESLDNVHGKPKDNISSITNIELDGNIFQKIFEKELMVFVITTKHFLFFVSTLVVIYLVCSIDSVAFIIKTTVYYVFPNLKNVFEPQKPFSLFQTVFKFLFGDSVFLFLSQCPC